MVGRTALLVLILATQFVPAVVIVLPFFVMFRDLGLLDTISGLVLVNTAIVMPFAIWMIKGFIDGIPVDTEEAALVDGSSRWQVIRNVVLPMAAPGLVTAAIFCFIIAWNEFLFALILTNRDAVTLPVGLALFKAEEGDLWNLLAAAGIIIMVPMFVLALIIRKHFVQGMTMGSGALMAGVSLVNVTKRWGDFVGVDDQSLEIADKEFLVLLGPSGCGKTTTMRMIAGLEEPTRGDIMIGERRVNDDLPKDRDVAMVFQNYGLYPHMTVADNIAYPLKVRGVPRAEIPERVRTAAEQVELVDFLERRPKALSGGQRQRVALARAIVRTPQVFLMDEPLSNLDAKLRVTMRAELKNLSHRLRITTVYVTHDQIEAMTLADRVAVMHDGRIEQLGTPVEIYNDPRTLFVAGFIGSPAMNLVEGEIRDGTFFAGGIPVLTVDAPSRDDLVLGLRPEDIRVVAPGEGDFDAPVFASENTGESVLATVRVGTHRITAKADRYTELDIDERIGLKVDGAHVYLFDRRTEARIDLPETPR